VGTSHQQRGELIVVLHAVKAGCHTVVAFGADGTVTLSLRNSSPYAEIDTLAAVAGGRLLMGGTDGQDEIVGRLSPDGRLDPSFGVSGWAKARPKEEPMLDGIDVPIATSVLLPRLRSSYTTGSSGVPISDEKTSPLSFHSSPAARRSSAWRLRCERTASSANGGSAMVRRSARERLTSPRETLPSGWRFMEPEMLRVGGSAPRSRSDHSRPVSSPGRSP